MLDEKLLYLYHDVYVYHTYTHTHTHTHTHTYDGGQFI